MNKKIILCLALMLIVAAIAQAYPSNGQTSFPVSIFAGPGGHLNPEGTATVARGTVIQITVLPDPGYHCVMFTINGHSFLPQPYITVTVSQNTTVSAFFEKD